MNEVHVDPRDAYESDDRNYVLFLAAIVHKTISLRSEALRRAEKGHG